MKSFIFHLSGSAVRVIEDLGSARKFFVLIVLTNESNRNKYRFQIRFRSVP